MQITKGPDGWQAKKYVPLYGKYEAKFLLKKRFGGKLAMTIIIVEMKDGFEVYQPHRDAVQQCTYNSVRRVTESIVRDIAATWDETDIRLRAMEHIKAKESQYDPQDAAKAEVSAPV